MTTRFKKAILAGLVSVGLVSLFLFLKASFAGEVMIDPVATRLFGFEIRWYGLLVGSVILIGLPWAVKRAGQANLAPERAEAALWWSIIGGVVGARFVYVVQNYSFYHLEPSKIIQVFDGGLSIHGMILGGLVVGYLAARFFEVEFWKLADAAVPPMILGMVIGRFGNFANHELFGYPTNLAWRMFVPEQFRPPAYLDSQFFHPVFLYEALLNLLVLCLILKFQSSVKFSGELLLRFLAGISVTRFTVEFFRIGQAAEFGLTSAQLVSLVIITVSLILIGLGRKHKITFS